MAGKARFRVPTLEEMDRADNQAASTSSMSLFKRSGASKSADAVSTAKNDDPLQPNTSPTKRRISQKALMSHMPIPRSVPIRKNKTVSKKTGSATPVSPEKSTSPVKSSGLSTLSGNPLSRHRVSHVADINVNKLKPNIAAETATSGTTSKEITSKWTGSTLGGNNRNAQLPPTQTRPPEKNLDTTSAREATRTGPASIEQPGGSGGVNKPDQSKEDQDSVRADVLPTLAKLGKTNSLVVNQRQRGNPILKFVRNVPWEFGNIVPDYVMGQSNCALYLSLRYHQLHPEYIHTRLKQLGNSFDLRVLLVQVDIKDPHHLLKDLAKICILADCTLMLAFSAEEAGRYLETYKVYENKAAEAIMERTDSSFTTQLSDCLTRVKSVNKTDCSTLLATFGNLQGIMEASTEDLSLCPGFGPQKAKRLHDVFREPFLVSKKIRADTKD